MPAEGSLKKDRLISKSFRASEFRCRCRSLGCNAPEIDMVFVGKLQALRDAWGKPFVINSGSRCSTWNAIIGGKPDSQHLQGKAADVHLDDPSDGPKISALAEKIGMGGIGLGKSFIHVDDGPAGRRWSYP